MNGLQVFNSAQFAGGGVNYYDIFIEEEAVIPNGARAKKHIATDDAVIHSIMGRGRMRDTCSHVEHASIGFRVESVDGAR